MLPFVLFALLFLLLPVSFLVLGSFQDASGSLTLQNYSDLARPDIVDAFRVTIGNSLVTGCDGHHECRVGPL